jgi:hypothetical protein
MAKGWAFTFGGNIYHTVLKFNIDLLMFRNVRFLKWAIGTSHTTREGEGIAYNGQQSKKPSDNDEFSRVLNEQQSKKNTSDNNKFSRVVNEQLSRQTPDDDEFSRLLDQGESESIEFMSPAAWSFGQLDPDNDITPSPEHITRGGDAPEFILAKTMAGFLNTHGGNLIMGLPENKEDQVEGDGTGTENDYQYARDNVIDGYQRMIIDSVQKYFDTDFFTMQSMFLSIEFKKIRGKTVCRIKIKKSERPLFLTSGNEDVFFVRTGAQTREIRKIKELYGYISHHFQR